MTRSRRKADTISQFQVILPWFCNMLLLFIIVAAWFNYVASDSYESEVKSIAASRVYYTKDPCPTSETISSIRETYIQQIPQGDLLKKSWAIQNFTEVYVSACVGDL